MHNFTISAEFAPSIIQCGLNRHGLQKEEVFYLEDAWSLHFYHWKGEFIFQNKSYAIEPGALTIAPPAERLIWKYHQQNAIHYYVHFKIDIAPSNEMLHLDLKKNFPTELMQLSQTFESIINGFNAGRIARAKARLWWLLHELSGGEKEQVLLNVNLPFVLQTAISVIQNEMKTHLSVRTLAPRLGISQSQLLRYFKKHFNCTINEYIQKVRMHRANELLLQTSMPIKSIAEEVGVDDLQYFNKLCRLHFDLSPRKIRTRPQ